MPIFRRKKIDFPLKQAILPKTIKQKKRPEFSDLFAISYFFFVFLDLLSSKYFNLRFVL